MAVYYELQPIDAQASRTTAHGGRRPRAGIPDVRRPLRGIERKTETFAYFRVIQGDGTPLDLVDSSQRDGEGPNYANFLLQSVQESRMERQQILETFGAPYIFFFGESPRFVDVTAVLLDTQDFNWHAEWWENYQKYLRATKLSERGSTALLHYDDVILEGYPVQAMSARDSGNHNVVQLQFKMFVTNYLNVSNVGDPNYPLREEAVLPQSLNERDDRTFVFAVDPAAQAQEAEYLALKSTIVQAIQEQIRRAESVERVRELQRMHSLAELGVDTEGMNLVTAGKGIFQGVVSLVRRDGEGFDAAMKRVGDETRKALQFSKDGQVDKALELLGLKEKPKDLDAVTAAQGIINQSLLETLQQGLRYSASSQVADLTAFLERVQNEVYGGGPRQLIEPKRTLPLRTKIADNFEEYTQRGDDQALIDRISKERLGVLQETGGPLSSRVNDSLTSSGAKVTPKALREMNLYSWSPGKGLQKTKVPFDSSQPLSAAGKKFTYSKQWGTTPDAGGSYGGSLGGTAGSGTGGMSQTLEDLLTPGSGLAQGDAYGNPNLPPYAYTDGLGPDGQELYKKEFKYGPTEGGSLFGGGVVVKEVNKKSKPGEGAFTIVVLEGTLQ